MATPSSQKAAQVQLQIRQNAMEMQDYLRDLGDWEKSIKKRDAALRGGSTAPAPAEPRSRPVPVRNASRRTISSGYAKPAPPPRGKPRTQREKKSEAKSGAAATESRHPSAHTYDKGYNKWENFDVDKALADAEASSDEESDAGGDAGDGEEEAGGGQGEASVTPASMLPPPSAQTREVMEAPVAGEAIPIDKAPARPREEVEKEAGNRHFKAGRFSEAVKCYTRAIGLNPSQSVYHSNRAIAYLRMKEYGPAREDCNTALRLDPTHAKAWTRRASAHNGLGCHAAAAADLQRAVALAPGSKFLQSELRKSLDLAKSTVRKAPKATLRVESVQHGASGAPGRASTTAQAAPAPAATATSAPGPAPSAQERGPAPQAEAPARLPQEEQVPSQVPSQVKAPEPAQPQQQQRSARQEQPVPEAPVSETRGVDQPQAVKEEATPAAATASPAAGSRSSPSKRGGSGAQRQRASPRKPALPKSSYEFEREWRSLHGDSSARRKLARLLTGKKVSKLFKTCPEADLLVSVLEGWLDVLRQPKAGAQEARRGADVACAFAALPRFSVTAMLLGEEEKRVIAKLAAAVREAAQRGGEGEEGAANEERVRSALM